MPDRFGPRGVFAFLIPQQNANMHPEYELMRPEGVNNQMYRFDISAHDKVAEAVLATLPQCHGCYPDMIITANSIEMRNWSLDIQADYVKKLAAGAKGVPVVTATEATTAALRSLGAKRIAVLSPMTEVYSKSVQAYYQSLGFDVPYDAWLEVKESIDIIKVTVDQILEGFRSNDHADVDTFLHVGGALGMVAMIDELEQKLGRPIVSSNAATYWYAMRKAGIKDTRDDLGKLWTLEDVVE
jgi:maleate isomerase